LIDTTLILHHCFSSEFFDCVVVAFLLLVDTPIPRLSFCNLPLGHTSETIITNKNPLVCLRIPRLSVTCKLVNCDNVLAWDLPQPALKPNDPDDVALVSWKLQTVPIPMSNTRRPDNGTFWVTWRRDPFQSCTHAGPLLKWSLSRTAFVFDPL
jgi:hypothetical protein